MANSKRQRHPRESGEKQPMAAPKKRKCHKYERGRCAAQEECHMVHTLNPIGEIPCKQPVATEMQRLQLGMSSCNQHLMVCARSGPGHCKYNHEDWNAELHEKALALEQAELENETRR